MSDLLLGKDIPYPDRYAPELLTALPRGEPAEFCQAGEDLWNAWEVSWLNAAGLPEVAVLQMRVPLASPCIVESKSLKLYLHSLNTQQFEHPAAFLHCVSRDLSSVLGAAPPLQIHLLSAAETLPALTPVSPQQLAGALLAAASVGTPLIGMPAPAEQNAKSVAPVAGGRSPHEDSPGSATGLESGPAALHRIHFCDGACAIASKNESGCGPQPNSDPELVKAGGLHCWYSDRLRTLCPVTGQPDWATVFVVADWHHTMAATLDHQLTLLQGQRDFHETCVEVLFRQLRADFQSGDLFVFARYTRRGGIDINPWRGSRSIGVPNLRLVRQ